MFQASKQQLRGTFRSNHNKISCFAGLFFQIFQQTMYFSSNPNAKFRNPFFTIFFSSFIWLISKRVVHVILERYVSNHLCNSIRPRPTSFMYENEFIYDISCNKNINQLHFWLFYKKL